MVSSPPTACIHACGCAWLGCSLLLVLALRPDAARSSVADLRAVTGGQVATKIRRALLHTGMRNVVTSEGGGGATIDLPVIVLLHDDGRAGYLGRDPPCSRV